MAQHIVELVDLPGILVHVWNLIPRLKIRRLMNSKIRRLEEWRIHRG